MRRFAELDDTNTVTRVIVAESAEWCETNLGGVWVETFTDGTRKNRAGVGFTFDADLDAFISPKPFDSWILNADCQWEPPTPRPVEGKWEWDESAVAWVEVVEPSA